MYIIREGARARGRTTQNAQRKTHKFSQKLDEKNDSVDLDAVGGVKDFSDD